MFELVWIVRKPAESSPQPGSAPDETFGPKDIDLYIARLQALDPDDTDGIVERVLSQRGERLSEAEPQVRTTMERVARRIAELPLD